MIVVLVVSSEGHVSRHVRSVLGSQGWWVATASGREEALRAAADRQPGLVVVDCEVEGAAELVRTFGSKNGGPGVLLLEPAGGGEAFFVFEAGADQILSKPPKAQALLEAAQRVMSLPYQASGVRAADLGEKLSASEIFGDVLTELDALESRAASAAGTPDARTRSVPEPRTDAQPELDTVEEPVDQEPSRADRSVAAESETAAVAASAAGRGESAGEESSARFDPKTLGLEADTAERPYSTPETASEAPEKRASEPPAPAQPEPEPEPEPARPAPAAGPTVDPGESSRPKSRSAPADARNAPEEEGRFGQYRLDERIAVGGMAEVWRASMLGLEGFRKTVAIKKILPHLAENDEFVTMFIEEAKLAARLSHENLVEIYDLGKIEDSYFIAMEYVDGKDLRGLMNRLRQVSQSMPVGLALLIAAQVARGLEYAHTREDGEGQSLDLVHRDVSPRNVLIGHDGRVRLCDFGVAKAVSSVIQTQIGALKGKLQYMSPEQASGKPADNRSDIYSLGSVMYEMVTGRRIHEEDNEISLLDAARSGNFDDPRKHCPDLPDEVRGILIKALAKKPAARYQSAGALEEDLRGFLRTFEPTPDAQALRLFVRDLFDSRRHREQAARGGERGSRSVAALPSAGPRDVTRTLQGQSASAPSRVARFWLGVAAGLLVAGLGATVYILLSS